MKTTLQSLAFILMGATIFFSSGMPATYAHDGKMHSEVMLSASITKSLDKALMVYGKWDKDSRVKLRGKLTVIEKKMEKLPATPKKKLLQDVLWYLNYHFHAVDAVLDAPNSPSVETQNTLGGLLQEHVNLGLNVLRNAYDGSEAFPASLDKLDANTVEIAAVIGSVYGMDAEKAFTDLWRNHIGFFANYTVGLKTNDTQMMMKAKEDLAGYAEDAATFFTNAIPGLDKAAVKGGAQMHAMHLVESMDAYAAGDYAKAFMLQREGNKHVAGLASVLVGGIVKQFPDAFKDVTVDPTMALMTKSAGVKFTLNSLMKEHVALGLNVLRNAYDGSEAFPASLDKLDANTVEIAAVIGSVYGMDAEKAFTDLWRNHIGFFANYTVGLKTNDTQMMMKAKEDLTGYAKDAATFFNAAIPSLMKENLMKGAQMHAMHLVESMDAYAAGDYAKAFMLQREGTMGIAGLANMLTNGVVMQSPQLFE